MRLLARQGWPGFGSVVGSCWIFPNLVNSDLKVIVDLTASQGPVSFEDEQQKKGRTQ